MRLFLGIELPDHWRQALTQGAAQLKEAGVRGSFTQPSNYHLTLVFLGETDRKEAEISAFHQIKGAPFSLRSASPGCFSKKGGDIWWLGVEPVPGLMTVQQALDEQLRAAGFPLEKRPYRPHITLARRVRSPAGLDLLTAPGLFPPLECRVGHLTLFSSERVEGVLRYIPLYRAQL